MKHKIHDIFDVILKLIILVYGEVFLNYIGIEEEIDEILNVEFVALNGTKRYVDFLCRLKNGKLLHVEFQYPYAKDDDEIRFFDYNIQAQVKYETITETAIFNFTENRKDSKPISIGETKFFNPRKFYLGDVDFKRYCKNINKKSKSNSKLSHFEEITLLLIPVFPKFQGDFKIMNKIANIVKRNELFDESKYDLFLVIFGLEIENFLSEVHQNEISEDMKMSPRAEKLVLDVMHEVNQKTLAETEMRGVEKGSKETMEKFIVAFKDQLDINDLARVSG